MAIGLFGKKIGMTQIFDHEGFTLPVTVINVGPCMITQLKTKKVNGYDAIQLGYLKGKSKNFRKSELGLFKKNGLPYFVHLHECKVSNIEEYSVGELITLENFQVGQFVNVIGNSIGKGFSGNQRRHNFKRGPMTHGSKNHRAPGSIGPGTTPGRVFPGKRMAGQLGSKQITISRLKIMGIDNKENLLIVKGSVPGKIGNLVNIIKSR